MDTVKVEIMGNEYVLRSTIGEAHIKRVAAHLNAMILETMEAAKTTNTLAATILTALNITNDLLRLQDAQQQTLREIEAKSERLLELIGQDVS